MEDPSFITANGNVHHHPSARFVDPNLKRKLFNDTVKVESDNEPLHVYVRLKPCLKEPSFKVLNSETLACKVSKPENAVEYLHQFTFTKIFGPNASQKELFDGILCEPMHNFINGKTYLIFAYGTTNSGKTYTMQGNYENPGMIPHALHMLFTCLNDRLSRHEDLGITPEYNIVQRENSDQERLKFLKSQILQNSHCESSMQGTFSSYEASFASSCSQDTFMSSCYEPSSVSSNILRDLGVSSPEDLRYAVFVSFAEIHNENIYDLLQLQPADRAQRKHLHLGQTASGRVYIKDITQIPVQSSEEVFSILRFGQSNLQFASTGLNAASSRSHSIFTIHLVCHANTDDPSSACMSNFSFCDLAGTERAKKTGNTGEALKESQRINTSLMVLGKCITVIKRNQGKPVPLREPVPFRESKLTRLFQNALCGDAKMAMIINMNQDEDFVKETMHILTLSAIAKQISLTSDHKKKRQQQKTRFSVFLCNEAAKEKDCGPADNRNASYVEDLIREAEKLRQKLDEKEKIMNDLRRRHKEEVEAESVRTRIELSNEFQSIIEEINREHDERYKLMEEAYEKELAWRGKHIERYYQKKIKEDDGADGLQAKVKELAQQIEEKDLTIREHEVIITELKKENESLKLEIVKDDVAEGLQAKVNVLSRRIEEKDQKIAEHEASITELKKENASLEAANQNLKLELAQARDDTDVKTTVLEQQLRDKNQEINELSDLVESAKIDYKSLEKENKDLESEIIKLKSENMALKGENAELEVEIAALNYDTQTQINAAREDDLISHTEEVERFKKIIEDLRNKMDKNGKEEMEEREKFNQYVEQETQQIKQKNKELVNERQQVEKEKQALEEEKNNIQKLLLDNEQKKQEIDTERDALEKMKKYIETGKREIEDKRNYVDNEIAEERLRIQEQAQNIEKEVLKRTEDIRNEKENIRKQMQELEELRLLIDAEKREIDLLHSNLEKEKFNISEEKHQIEVEKQRIKIESQNVECEFHKMKQEKARIEEERKQIEDEKEINKEQAQQIEASKLEIAGKILEISKIMENIEKEKKSIEENKIMIEDQREEVHKFKLEEEALRKRREKEYIEIEQERECVERKTKEVDAIALKIKELQERTEKEKENVEKQKSFIQEQAKILAMKEHEIETKSGKFETERLELEDRIDRNEKIKIKIEEELKKYKDDNAKLEERIQGFENHKRRSDEEICLLRSELERVVSELHKTDAENLELLSKVESTEENLKITVERYKKQFSEYEKMMEKKDEQIKIHKREINGLQGVVNISPTAKLHQLEETARTKCEENMRLKEMINDLQKKLDVLKLEESEKNEVKVVPSSRKTAGARRTRGTSRKENTEPHVSGNKKKQKCKKVEESDSDEDDLPLLLRSSALDRKTVCGQERQAKTRARKHLFSVNSEQLCTEEVEFSDQKPDPKVAAPLNIIKHNLRRRNQSHI